MPNVTLDAIAGVLIDDNNCVNEQRTLQMLSTGLVGIAGNIKQRELAWQKQFGPNVRFQSHGLDIDGTKGYLDQIACFSHWFGVSLYNYARLVGFVPGLTVNDFSRADLSDPTKFKAVKESVDKYINAVPELSDVVVWRNKVGAHFAITAPHKSDNHSTLDMSIMYPVTFTNGQYRVGELTLTWKNSSGTHNSAIPCWSLTEVFEKLIPRYWPEMTFATNAEVK
jgi:hypothetical protein